MELIFPIAFLVATKIIRYFMSFFSVIFDLVFYYFETISFFDKIINVASGRIDPSNKAIFITGSETGLGYQLTRRLLSKGFTVFAGVKELDEETYDLFKHCGPNVRLVQCDVIKYKDVNEAAKHVAKNLVGKYLWCVISTANFAPSPSSKFPGDRRNSHIDNHDESLKINALGSARLTKAFLPLLRRTKKSRIIFLSNMSANIELPSTISYAMSRASETSFGYTMRKELKHYEVYVSIFEPTSFTKERTDSLASTLVPSPCPSVASSPPETPDIPEESELTKQSLLLFNRDRRRSSILIPCLKLTEEEPSSESLEELMKHITSPIEPPLFISLKKYL